MRLVYLWLVATTLGSTLAKATPTTELPALQSEFHDEAGLVSVPEADRLRSLVRGLNHSRGIQLAVLVTKTTNGLELEPFSIRLAEKWQLGRAKAGIMSDRGLLWIIHPAARKMRLEVGRGLEGELTDLFSKRLLRDTVGSHFKRGAHAAGIAAGIAAIDEKLTGGTTATPYDWNKKESPLWRVFGILLFVLLVVVRFFERSTDRSRWRQGRRGSTYSTGSAPWNFGGGGGGGFSGGGGGFSGGGASSSW